MSAPAKPGIEARKLAAEALVRIDRDGAYANLLLPALLAEAPLDERDRGFVTELVYGTCRMQRACDWLVDRFALRDVDPVARVWLRLGAYQLVMLGTPPHAAVSATVEAAPRKLRGFLNAVLRRVAEAPADFPDDATRLSYPDWIVSRLTTDLGADEARRALETMNGPGSVTRRADGYVQDLASQWVVDLVGALPADTVLDLSAAPGGKATGLARRAGHVVAVDLHPARAGLVAANVHTLGLTNVSVVAADGRRAPLRASSFDRVLLDAPCSGLGALRRRPDARWRIGAADVGGLAHLQRELLDAAVGLLRPGGTLVYSVCTLTEAETVAIDDHAHRAHPGLAALEPPGVPWVPWGRGALLTPQTAGTDGMYVLRLTRAR